MTVGFVGNNWADYAQRTVEQLEDDLDRIRSAIVYANAAPDDIIRSMLRGGLGPRQGWIVNALYAKEKEKEAAGISPIESSLSVTSEVTDTVKGLIRWTKRFSDLEFVYNASRMSYKVEEDLQETIEKASEADKIPLSNDDFVAWSKSRRGHNNARGNELTANALVNMLYLAYATVIALEYLPDWTHEKCEVLEDKADANREKESDAAQERADKYDEIRDEFYPIADEAQGCCWPAGDLRNALESGNLTDAVDSIQNGDLFLDIGAPDLKKFF